MITTNIYRRQAYDSVMCGYFRIGFIDFMLKGKSFTDFIYMYVYINDHQQFRLNRINKVRDYFIAEINPICPRVFSSDYAPGGGGTT